MTKSTKIKPLSARRLRFCQNYISADTDREAAIAAGYSEKSAHVAAARLLKDANVLAEITRRQEEASERADIKDDDVIRMLLEDREAARAAKQYGPAVRAAELLGRKLGMFKDRIDVNGGPERDRQIIESLAGEDPAKRAALKLIMGSDGVFETPQPHLVVDNDGAA